MIATAETECVAFEGPRLIGAGALRDVVLAVRAATERGREPVLVFDAESSTPIEVDTRGSEADVIARLPVAEAPVALDESDAAPAVPGEPRGPGRPRLGVVAREITLLPRHWEWLGTQPGGASVVLRKLVDEARKSSESRDRARVATEAAYRFISTMAGNQPGFEEASRTLFAGNARGFAEATEEWPGDVRAHARALASRVGASLVHNIE